MKKTNKKAYIILTASAIMLVILSTLLLKKGISFTGDIGTGRIDNILIGETFEESINSSSMVNSDSIKSEPVDLKKQEALYESEKDKINIQKEDAKGIFKKIYIIYLAIQ